MSAPPDPLPLRPRALLFCAIFVIALLARSPWLFTGVRLWAEEGKYYYALLQGGDLLSAVTLVVRGNYQLLVNLSAFLAQAVPAVWAAHVTTAVALLTALVVVILIAELSVQQRWTSWSAALAVLVLAWLPSGYEIYLTSTNVQWLCSVAVLLLVLVDARPWPAYARHAATAWLLVCALTGVPSAMLAPFMLWRGVRGRSPIHLWWGAALAVGALVQVAVIASHSHEGRAFALQPVEATLAFLVQSIYAPVLGVTWLEPLLATSFAPGGRALLVAGVATALLLAGAMLRAVGSPASPSPVTGYLALAAVVTAFVNMFGGLGSPSEYISAWSGGRYFFLAQVGWLLLLVAAVNASTGTWRHVALALLACAIVSGWTGTRTGAWKEFMLSGPSWRATVQYCKEVRPCTVEVWPRHNGWTFELRNR